MKKTLALILGSAILGGSLLYGCGSSGTASLNNQLSDSIYCTVEFDEDYDFTALNEGDTIGFTITPEEDYFIGTATVNGTAIDSDGAGTTEISTEDSAHYTIALAAGSNRLACTFNIDPTVDFVEKFDLNIDASTFYSVLMRTNTLDFRQDGIEQMRTEYTHSNDFFINYVDGDTTHMETYHYAYTVKIRYLSIDTPESTSELEEWGKSASLYNQSCLEGAKRVILQSQGRAMYPELEDGQDETAWASGTDANGRNLAYVWYSTETGENLTAQSTAAEFEEYLSTFRCLNLEMVYEGFSYGTGSISDSGLEYYKVFEKARRSAEANKRGMFSGEKDDNYWYDDPIDLTLEEIYSTDKIGGVNSEYNDEYRLYRVQGYVSRKIEGAFYFQNKYDYEQDGTEVVEDAYGMYVFTYTQTTIQPGDLVEVIGVLSEYGGNLQMMGISWNSTNPDPDRDTRVIEKASETGVSCVPIKVTRSQWNTVNYNHVLVEFVDDVYGQDVKSSTRVSGVYNDYGEGGTHAINKYNTTYPFYNDSNKLIFQASIGQDDPSIALNSTGSVRITVAQEIICSYGIEYGYTYKFFTGGTNYYLAGNPEAVAYMAGIMDYSTGANSFAAFEETYEQYKDQVVVETYTRKQFHLVGISQYYTSTSGQTTAWTLNVVKAGDVTITDTFDV